MVLSIGTDIVDVKRVERAIKRRGERFGRKILCPDELTEWQKRKFSPAFLAKRFAAKEAIAKALGTGIGKGVTFQNIEISNDAGGAPRATLNRSADQVMRNFGARKVLLSISDERNYAVAFAVLSN